MISFLLFSWGLIGLIYVIAKEIDLSFDPKGIAFIFILGPLIWVTAATFLIAKLFWSVLKHPAKLITTLFDKIYEWSIK